MLNRREFMGTVRVLAGAALVSQLPTTPVFAAAEDTPSPSVDREHLLKNLAAVKKDVEVITNPDGTVLVVLPYGAACWECMPRAVPRIFTGPIRP